MPTYAPLSTLNVPTPCLKSFEVRIFGSSIRRFFHLSTVISVKQRFLGNIFLVLIWCDIILKSATPGLSDKPRGNIIIAWAHGE
jgi:hypothetical protein